MFLEAHTFPKIVSKSPATKNAYFKRGSNMKSNLCIIEYLPLLLPLYTLKDQLHGNFKNFPRLFLGINLKSQTPRNFLIKNYLKTLRIDEITHFLKHFDLPNPFFPSKIVSIYHFWCLTFAFQPGEKPQTHITYITSFSLLPLLALATWWDFVRPSGQLKINGGIFNMLQDVLFHMQRQGMTDYV